MPKLFKSAIRWIGCLLLLVLITCASIWIVSIAILPEPVFIRLYYIRSDVVQEICAAFDVPGDDPFCASQEEVHVQELEPMLRRRFPPNRTTFDDLLPYLQNMTSRPRASCYSYLDESQLRPDPCPDLSQCYSVHWCNIHVAGQLSIKVVFYPDEHVLSFQVPHHPT